MKHLLININNLYSQHCCVTLCSLFENNRRHKFHIHIFSFDIDSNNQNKIKNFVESYGNIVSFYILEDKNFTFPNIGNSHVSKETYIRLFSVDYLPSNIDKILYIDVDLLILKDIEELYNLELNENIIGAIEDYPLEERYSRLNIKKELGYFNAGVMIINLIEWRKNMITNKAINFLNNCSIYLRHHDQDILNILCNYKWIRIPFKWNILDIFFFNVEPYEEKLKDEIKKDILNPYIIHFSGKIKPWKAWSPHPYYKYYYFYLSKTPWKGFKPSIKTQWNAYKFPRNILTITKLDRILSPLKKKLKKT